MGRTIGTFAKLGLARIRKKALLLLLILSLALLSGVAAAKIGADYFSQEDFQLSIALVMLDEDETMAQLMEFALSTPELTQSYNIVTCDSQDEGVALVEDNLAYACIVLPEDFLYSLQHGLNYPPLVILNSTQTADALVAAALCDVLTEMMRQTQSGIYAATDFVLAENAYDSSFYLDSNLVYLTQILDRTDSFQITDLPYASVLDLPTHYGLTLAIFLLLLSSALFYDILNIRQDFSAMKLLSAQSNLHQTLYFIQLFEVYILYFLLLLAVALGLGGTLTPLVLISIANGAALFLLGQAMIFQLIHHYLPAMVLSLFFHSLALIAAGGILPSLLLPAGLVTASNAFPLTHIRTLLSASLVTVDRLALLNLVVLSANWLLCSLLWNYNNKILTERGTSYDLR